MKRYLTFFCCLLLFNLSPLLPLCKISASVAFASEQALAEAEKLNSQLMELYNQGRYAEAIAIAERILVLDEKTLGPEHPGTAVTLNGLASLYQDSGQYAKAEPLYMRALTINEKKLGPDHSDTATTLNNLGTLYQSMGEFAKAEPLFKRSLAIDEKRLGPDHPDTSISLNNLAECYRAMGEYSKAEPLYKHSLAIREATLSPEGLEIAVGINNLALLYIDMGEYSKAEPLFKRSLASVEKVLGPDHPSTAMSVNNLAGFYSSANEYAKAEPLYIRALAINEKTLGPEHPDTASTLNNLAVVYQSMGEYVKAESLFKRALAINEKTLGPEQPGTAMALNNLAMLYHSRGECDKAKSPLKRALAIREKTLGPEHPDTASTLNNLALCLSGDEYAQAESMYNRVLTIQEKTLGPEHPDTAPVLTNLASVYVFQGEYSKAEQSYKRALDIVGRRGLRDFASIIKEQLGLTLLATGDPKQAIHEIQEAASLFESIRSDFGKEDTRVAFQARRGNIYGTLAAAYLALGQTVEAFEAIERGRSKAFVDLLGTRAFGRKSVFAKSEELIQLEKQIAQLHSERHKVLSKDAAGAKSRAAELDTKITALDKQRYDLIAQVSALDMELGSLLTVDPPKAADIQALLPEDVLLVEYSHIGEVVVDHKKQNQLWIFTLTKQDAIKFFSVDVPLEDFTKALEEYADLVANPDSNDSKREAVSAKLHDWIVSPISGEVASAKTVVVVPWGPMFKVPFGALAPAGGQPLIRDKALVVAPSAGVYEYQVKKRNSGRDRIFALGNPKTTLMDLPGAEEEAQEVAALFSQAALETRDKATEAKVKRDLERMGKPDVIHFACHGIFNESAPQMSYLALSPGQDEDGKLELHELYGLDWRGVSLVTMSACSSGRGKLGAGDDLMGMTRGFIYAGAPSVLATLWEVDDYATRELMVNFYKNYLDGLPKPEALRQAQLSLLNSEYSHPYYWASFALFGDWM